MKTLLQKIINDLDSYSGVIKLTVRDVGHGNWNEIKYRNKRILFDIGAQKNFGEEDLLEIIREAKFKIGEEIYIFISHWDVDHYHGILKLSDKELQLIKAIFGPANIPDTNTAKRVMNLINDAGIKFYGVPFTSKRHPHKQIELNPIFSGSKLKIYRSSETKSRNLDSVVMFLEGNKKSVLFSGDNTYEKIFDYVLTICKSNVPLNLILPHHGGRAGKFKINSWNTVNLENIIISFSEKNSYGHPLPENLKVSQILLASKPLVVTNGNGSIHFRL
jgi:beta-lactamase superfamily II metal-dependent hydrolase